MAVITTHLFNISFSHQDLINVLMKIDALAESVFPQDAKKIASNVKGVSIMEESNPYNKVLDDLYHLCDILHIEKPNVESKAINSDIHHLKTLIQNVYQELHQVQEVKEKLVSEREDNLEVIRAIKEIREADLNIDEVNECKYLTYRFGRLSKDQVVKIQYYHEHPFIYKKIREDASYVWVIYAGIKTNIDEIDNIFHALKFEEIKLPDFVHGTFEEAYLELEEEIRAMSSYITKMDSYITKIKNKYQNQLGEAFVNVTTLTKLYEKAKYVVDYSHKESIFVFSSLSREAMQKHLHDIDSVSLLELPPDMYDKRGIHGPILLHNHPFIQPFEKMSGISWGMTFDATPIIAMIVLAMSAILLGDIGAGIVLYGCGLLFSRGNRGRIVNRLGIAITVGGLLSGTIGYRWSLYAPIFALSVSLAQALMLWITIIFSVNIVIKVIQKMTKQSEMI